MVLSSQGNKGWMLLAHCHESSALHGVLSFEPELPTIKTPSEIERRGADLRKGCLGSKSGKRKGLCQTLYLQSALFWCHSQ